MNMNLAGVALQQPEHSTTNHFGVYNNSIIDSLYEFRIDWCCRVTDFVRGLDIELSLSDGA
jgi:hypothetical protein